MSETESRIAPGCGAALLPVTLGAQPGRDRERQPLEPPRAVEERRRVDRAVVAEVQQRDGVHLEVEVRRRALGVARVAHEADHLPRLDARAVEDERRERREVRVVEGVALPVAQPEPVAADLVPAEREDRAVGERDDRLAELAEDVVAVVVADVAADLAVGVAVAHAAEDREDVRPALERGRELRREREEARRRRRRGRRRVRASARASASSGFGRSRASAAGVVAVVCSALPA